MISSPEVSALFENSTSTRTACPLCREEGRDSTGDHLQIGAGRVHCFFDPDHGTELWSELKHGNKPPGLAPRKQAKPKPEPISLSPLPDVLLEMELPPESDLDPKGAFFHAEQAGPETDDFDSLRLRLEVYLTSHEGVLDDMDLEDLEGILRQAKFGYFAGVRQTFRYGWLMGRVLGYLKTKNGGHGNWLPYLEKLGISKDTAKRCMRAAEVPWEIAQGFPSMHKCMEYLNGGKTTKTHPLKAHNLALKKEVEDLQKTLVETQTKQASESPLQAKITRLEQEKRVLITKNTELGMKNRELEDRVAKVEVENEKLKKSTMYLDGYSAPFPDEKPTTNVENSANLHFYRHNMEKGEPGLDFEDFEDPPPELGVWQ